MEILIKESKSSIYLYLLSLLKPKKAIKRNKKYTDILTKRIKM